MYIYAIYMICYISAANKDISFGGNYKADL